MKKINVGGMEIGGGAPLVLIAGPCVIESEEHVHFLAREIADADGCRPATHGLSVTRRRSCREMEGGPAPRRPWEA